MIPIAYPRNKTKLIPEESVWKCAPPISNAFNHRQFGQYVHTKNVMVNLILTLTSLILSWILKILGTRTCITRSLLVLPKMLNCGWGLARSSHCFFHVEKNRSCSVLDVWCHALETRGLCFCIVPHLYQSTVRRKLDSNMFLKTIWHSWSPIWIMPRSTEDGMHTGVLLTSFYERPIIKRHHLHRLFLLSWSCARAIPPLRLENLTIGSVIRN